MTISLKRIKKVGIYIISVFSILLFSSLLCSNVAKAATLKISYNGKAKSYKGKQISVYLDNKAINMKNTKGLILSGNTMVSYKDIISSGIKAKCTYSSKNITIKQNDITIKLKVGSKTAYVNGKKKNLSIAPVSVKYIKQKKTKILIPLKFVAQNLGYTYSYQSNKARVDMKSPFAISYNSKWYVYNKYKGNLVFNDNDYSLAEMPGIYLNGCTMIPAENVFSSILGVKYDYNSADQSLTLTMNDNVLVLKVGQKTATLNGEAFALSAAPINVKRKDTGKTFLMVPASITCTKLGFYYEWSSVSNKSIITTKTYFSWKSNKIEYDKTKYNNTIYNVTSLYDKANKAVIISLVGTDPETLNKPEISSDGKNIEMKFPSTFNILGDNSATLNSSKICGSISIRQSEGQTVLNIVGKTSLNYSYTVVGNVLSITIRQYANVENALCVMIPEGVDYTRITSDDYYFENRFTITIPGNNQNFYNNNPIITSNCPSVSNVSTSLDVNGNTILNVSTIGLQGFKIENFNGYIVVHVGDPKSIYPNIVLFDAGHGGHDPGASNSGVKEKDLNLSMLYTCMKNILATTNTTYKSYWTRTDDTFISLQDRASYAKTVGADIFISLHMNSANSSSPKGTEVYYSTSNNGNSFSGISSSALATIIQTNLVTDLQSSNRGVKTANYTVIKSNSVPAVLIELGFLSNSSDLSKLTNSDYQMKAMNSVVNSINEVFQLYPTGR